MWGRREFVCGLFGLISVSVVSQNLVWNDSLVLFPISSLADSNESLTRFSYTQNIDYSLSVSNLLFLNWEQGPNDNQALFLQRIRYRSKIKTSGNVTLNTSFVNNLGVQLFFDSISRFQPDESTVDTWIEIKIKRQFNVTFKSNITTRLFNGYKYSTDTAGNLRKILNSSFLTPMIGNFSVGIGWNWPEFGMLSFGISSAKLTLISNQAVYHESGISNFYGVQIEKKFLFEYGLSFHLMVEKNFRNRVNWNCDLLIFKNYQKPVDVTMKNLVGIRINKFLKTSIQIRIYYEEETSKKIQVENLVSVGFNVTL